MATRQDLRSVVIRILRRRGPLPANTLAWMVGNLGYRGWFKAFATPPQIRRVVRENPTVFGFDRSQRPGLAYLR